MSPPARRTRSRVKAETAPVKQKQQPRKAAKEQVENKQADVKEDHAETTEDIKEDETIKEESEEEPVAPDHVDVKPKLGKGHFVSKTKVPKEVSSIYKIVQQRRGQVGGYGHNGPVYGEITMGTFHKIVEFLETNCEFSKDSRFLDIGSGLGKPNFHVAAYPGVQCSFGIELERLRWQLSVHNLAYALEALPKHHPHPTVYFSHSDATDIDSFDPFTHVYQFDIGFPPDALISIANAFNISRHVKSLVSFQKPRDIIGKYGFAVEEIGKISTRMHGSCEGHTAYIYRAKHNQKTPSPAAPLTSFLGVKLEGPRDDGIVVREVKPETDTPTTPVKKAAVAPRTPPKTAEPSRVRTARKTRTSPRRQQTQITQVFTQEANRRRLYDQVSGKLGDKVADALKPVINSSFKLSTKKSHLSSVFRVGLEHLTGMSASNDTSTEDQEEILPIKPTRLFAEEVICGRREKEEKASSDCLGSYLSFVLGQAESLVEKGRPRRENVFRPERYVC